MTDNETQTQSETMTLTEKEQAQVQRLMQLGDSKELAIETVVELRKKESNTEFYNAAYEG